MIESLRWLDYPSNVKTQMNKIESKRARRRCSQKTMANDNNNLNVNINDVALILEGGGMRASYTAGAVVTLLENNFNFGDVYGISAGSSNAVNYVSRDTVRTKMSFVDLVSDPEFGGLKTFVQGKGFFNAHHLYEGVAEVPNAYDSRFLFDWDTFCANPANVHIEALDRDTGETVLWTKSDMQSAHEMMLRVRASSTMPIFMPPTVIEGHTYMDGGLGSSWGIPLEAAKRDGYERFFIVRMQEKGYRKSPIGGAGQLLFKTAFRKYPAVWQKTIERPQHYNELCEEIERLEKSGAAYVFYPEEMTLTNRTTDLELLQTAYDTGYAQAQHELDTWQKWLQWQP